MGTQITDNKSLLLRIEKSLDTIRPFLEKDGGNIEVVGVTADMTLQVRLLGNCETCPMNFSTLKAGVEESVKKEVPEIRSVVSVE